MVRHRWELHEQQHPGRVRGGRFRLRLGRGATLCLLFAAVIWIAASLLFHPPTGSGEVIGAVDMDSSAATGSGADPTSSGAAGASASAAPGGAPAAAAPGGSTPPAGTAAEPSTTPAVVVHVAGAVRKPGVYRFSAGSRADDAVHAAGGLAPGALQAAVNLAAPLVDGQQLYIPTESEAASAPSGDGGGPAVGSGATGASTGQAGAADRINVNTASAEELQELPGVGPALSGRIVEFREANGPFASLAELDAVSGIGPTLIARFEPLVSFQ